MPKFLRTAEVINESNEHVRLSVQFESGNVQVHTLAGQKDRVLIERQDIEDKERIDPITKLVFNYHDKTEEKRLDDISDENKRVFKIGKDFKIQCDRCQ